MDVIVRQWENERPDLDLTAFGIQLRLRALAMLLDERGLLISSAVGLKHGELLVLYALRRVGKPYRLRPTNMFKHLKVQSGTITYRIDHLERQGMVSRVPDPEDRRSTMIQLTPVGKRTIDRAVDIAASDAAAALRPFTQDAARVVKLVSMLRELTTLLGNGRQDTKAEQTKASSARSRKPLAAPPISVSVRRRTA